MRQNKPFPRLAFLPLLCLLAWTTPTQAQQCVTLPGWQFARSRDVIAKAAHYARQGDKVAFRRLFETGLLLPLSPDVHVYLEDQEAGAAAIRLPGQMGHVWVPKEAIDCAP